MGRTKKKYINEDIIIDLKSKNYSLDKILKLYDDDKLDFKYEERQNKGISILKNKEEKSDIYISDFILKNYKKHKLFHQINHPTYIILKEMTKQILEKLEIKCNNFDKLCKNDTFEPYPPQCVLFHSKYDLKYYNFEY